MSLMMEKEETKEPSCCINVDAIVVTAAADADAAVPNVVPVVPLKKQFCYIVINESRRNTYVGYTVTPPKRLRQHNGEIKGGAKYTSRHGPGWSFVLVLTSSSPTFDNHVALSLEWHMKPHGKQRASSNHVDIVQRRIDLIIKALANPKFAHIGQMSMYVAPRYIERFTCAINEITKFNNMQLVMTSDLESIL
jgi:predicted GIY-YIG superfamily endonuclease